MNTGATSAEQIDDGVKLALARAEAEERIFALEQRRMKPYAESDLVPQHYRGRIANCLIAHEMAQRIGANTLSVMQNLYIVHGNPGWSAKFAISIFNTCGRFSAIKYRFDGMGDDYGCTAYATEKSTGEKVEGPKITWKLVKAEGWFNKNGSKWKTMPELMFRYRAAAYLVATTAPELLSGMRTAEEYEDLYGVQATHTPPDAHAAPSGIAAKLAAAKEIKPESVEPDIAEQTRAQIEADRAEALAKARAKRKETDLLGIDAQETEVCRPD